MINLFVWSGPRNISTALMRSFENRKDTKVYDEPFYAYYLKKTNLNHPMKDEIIDHYYTNEDDVINLITKEDNKYKIFYQKHMTHHILDETRLDWINKGINCFLIRDPAKVIVSYLKKNTLKSIQDVGFKKLYEIFKKLLNIDKSYIIGNKIKHPPAGEGMPWKKFIFHSSLSSNFVRLNLANLKTQHTENNNTRSQPIFPN